MFGNKYKEQISAIENECVLPLLTTDERIKNYNRYKILIRQRIKQALVSLSDPTISKELNEHVLKSYIYMYVGNVYNIFSAMYPDFIVNYKIELKVVSALREVFKMDAENETESSIEEILFMAVGLLSIMR